MCLLLLLISSVLWKENTSREINYLSLVCRIPSIWKIMKICNAPEKTKIVMGICEFHDIRKSQIRRKREPVLYWLRIDNNYPKFSFSFGSFPLVVDLGMTHFPVVAINFKWPWSCKCFPRVATAQGKQGIWFLLFPDSENTGNFVVTWGKFLRHREKYFWRYLLMQKACFSTYFQNFLA